MRTAFIVLCALIVLSFAHSDDDDDQWEACTVKTPLGHFYLNSLARIEGDFPYLAYDNEGDAIYFNFCGTLEGLNADSCSKDAAACVTIGDSSFVAGLPSNDWVREDNGLMITYENGDDCNSGQYSTEIHLICAVDSNFLVTSVDVSEDGCKFTITAQTGAACEVIEHNWHPHHKRGGFVLFPMFLSFLLCACFVAICGCCIRRRRCRRIQRESQNSLRQAPQNSYPAVSYHNLQEDTSSSQEMSVPMTPMYYPAQYVPINPPVEGQYPVQQQQQPFYYYYPYPIQQPVTPHAPTMLDLNSNVVIGRETQLTQDEKLARDLQAKYDKE